MVYEGDDCNKIYEISSRLKKIKKSNIFSEKYKDLMEYPDFEQGYWSRTAIGVYKKGHGSIRLLKWLAFFMIGLLMKI